MGLGGCAEWDLGLCQTLRAIDEPSVVSLYGFGADELMIRCTVGQTDDPSLAIILQDPHYSVLCGKKKAEAPSLHICRVFCKLLKVRICT